MKNWSLSILVGAAVLSLQACDITIHDSPSTQAASTSEPMPAAAATPKTDTSIASSAPQEPVGTAPGAEMPAADAQAPEAGAEAPAAAASAATDSMAAASPPQTNAIGAPAAATSTDATAMAADTTAAGVAAPTELARFLQEKPIRASAGSAEAGKEAAGNSEAAKAEGKSGDRKS